MTQEAILVTTTPPLPGLTLVNAINDANLTIATNFAGSDDPAADADAYMTWADTATGFLKRRNAANSAWTIVGRIYSALYEDASGNLGLGNTNPTEKLDVTGNVKSSGSMTDQFGNVRDISKSGSAKTSSYTLLTSDIGQFIEVGTGGSVTIPDATFAAGDAVSVFNNTSGDVTITCTITNAYIGGVNTDEASVTLATRGVATILFISGTVCVITGNVS